MLKWFKGLHFKLQSKDRNFEKSTHVISLQTMILVSPLSYDIELYKNHMIESFFINLNENLT